MLKKTIKYTDFNGQEQEDDFYFNLTKAEIAEMELGAHTKENPGGLGDHLKRIAESQNGSDIIEAFTDLIRKAYGRKSEDGKRFIKTDEQFEEFRQTEAYSEFFMELVTDAKAASDFVNAIVPADLAQRVQDQVGVPADRLPKQNEQ